MLWKWYSWDRTPCQRPEEKHVISNRTRADRDKLAPNYQDQIAQMGLIAEKRSDLHAFKA